MSTNHLTQTAWADHLRSCAEIANGIADKLGLRDDAARQACFATITIDATKHNVFLSPIPEQETNGKATKPAKVPDPVAAKDHDAKAAAKADAQIKEIDPHPTPEKLETVTREKLLEGVNSAVKLLNQAGFTPPMTPKSLNAFIKTEMNADGGLGTLDIDHLEALLELLNKKIDVFKSNKAALDEAPF